jgi:hypothetical protein
MKASESRPASSEPAASLLLRAAMCRRLADSAAEVWVAVSLRELAEELVAHATRASARSGAKLASNHRAARSPRGPW